jgi:hypothetical protein
VAAFVTISWLAQCGGVCYNKLARRAWQRLFIPGMQTIAHMKTCREKNKILFVYIIQKYDDNISNKYSLTITYLSYKI